MRKNMRGNAVNCGSYAKIMRSFVKTKKLGKFRLEKEENNEEYNSGHICVQKIIFWVSLELLNID